MPRALAHVPIEGFNPLGPPSTAPHVLVTGFVSPRRPPRPHRVRVRLASPASQEHHGNPPGDASVAPTCDCPSRTAARPRKNLFHPTLRGSVSTSISSEHPKSVAAPSDIRGHNHDPP